LDLVHRRDEHQDSSADVQSPNAAAGVRPEAELARAPVPVNGGGPDSADRAESVGGSADRAEAVGGSAGPAQAEDHGEPLPDPADAEALRARLLALAGPILLEHLLAMLVGWSDTVLTGWIFGTRQHLAAVTVTSYLLWLLEVSTALVATGTQAIVARMTGARDPATAGRMAHQSLRLALVLGVALTVLCHHGAELMLRLVRLDVEARALAGEYLSGIAPGCVPMAFVLVAATCLRASGRPALALIIMGTVNVINVIASWMLSTGVLGCPNLGFRGIAVGSSIGFAVGAVFAAVMLARGSPELTPPRPWPGPALADLWRILRIGVPGAITALTTVGCHLVFLSIINGLGPAATAAHGVALRSESIAYLSVEAIGLAAATLAGQYLGARRPDGARRAARLGMRLSVVCLTVVAVVFLVAAPWIITLFAGRAGDDVRDLAVPLLRTVAFGLPPFAICVTLTMTLQGAGDTRTPLVINLIGFGLIRIPLALLLTGSRFDLGVQGAWLAMIVDLLVRSALVHWRFHAGHWLTVKV
jgi:putative MATE family efflux protein